MGLVAILAQRIKEAGAALIATPARPLSLAEGVSVATALTSLILAQLLWSDSLYMFSRMFWFDEIVTYVLVTDPDAARAAAALWQGVDNNTPGLFVLLRVFTWLIDNTSEPAFRSFSFLSVLLGLFGVYVSLRRCFSPLAAFTTVLAIWTHPLMLFQAFNARYYAPLFAAAVWFAYFLSRAPGARNRFWANLAIGSSALVLCLIHYLGILSMLLVVFGELLHRRGVIGSKWRGFGPTVLGPLALVACIPLLISHSSRVSVTSWLPPPTLQRISQFGIELMLPVHLAVIPLVVWVSYVAMTFRQKAEASYTAGSSLMSLTGLSALALTPAFLVGYSYFVPILLGQYAIASVAGLAPGIALVLARVSRSGLIALCLFFVLVGARDLRYQAARHQHTDQRKWEVIDTIRRHTGSHPVTWEHFFPHEIAHYAPDLSPRLFYLNKRDFDRVPTINAHFFNDAEWKRARTWGSEWARRFAAVYGYPAVMEFEHLRDLPIKYLIVGRDPIDQQSPSEESYSGFRLRHVERSLYELVNDPTAEQR